MRKGDRGIQPRNWGEKKMVVQDPFLWLKVSVNYLFPQRHELTRFEGLHRDDV